MKLDAAPATLVRAAAPAFLQPGATVTVSFGWKTPLPAPSTASEAGSRFAGMNIVDASSVLFVPFGSGVVDVTVAWFTIGLGPL